MLSLSSPAQSSRTQIADVTMVKSESSVSEGFGRVMIVVYMERNGIRHIISMRKANDREQRRFFPNLY
jgi:uncharacterized DUF497 family protein